MSIIFSQSHQNYCPVNLAFLCACMETVLAGSERRLRVGSIPPRSHQNNPQGRTNGPLSFVDFPRDRPNCLGHNRFQPLRIRFLPVRAAIVF